MTDQLIIGLQKENELLKKTIADLRAEIVSYKNMITRYQEQNDYCDPPERFCPMEAEWIGDGGYDYDD